jgi:hypothetical protein
MEQSIVCTLLFRSVQSTPSRDIHVGVSQQKSAWDYYCAGLFSLRNGWTKTPVFFWCELQYNREKGLSPGKLDARQLLRRTLQK